MKNLLFLVLLFLFFTSACSQFNPYVDSRREAGIIGNIGPSNLDKVSICYNSLSCEPAQIIDIAEAECKKTGRIAKFYRQVHWDCSLLTPTRVEYLCQKP